MKKTVTVAFTTVVMMVNSLCMIAGANDSVRQQEVCQGDPGYGISNIPLEQQLEDFLDNPNLTEEQKRAAEEKVNSAIQLRDNSSVQVQSTGSYRNITLSVTAYKQETRYYCGPATTRQSLDYLSGYAPGYFYLPTQTELANKLGTTTNGTEWYRIRNYLNGFSFPTFQPNYVEYTPTSCSNMTSTLYRELNSAHPILPILQVNAEKNKDILGYTTKGHYMNVSGIKTVNGQVKFQLTDPYREWAGKEPKYYLLDSEIYEVTRNHWAKHFLW